jgi:hypothetical protein
MEQAYEIWVAYFEALKATNVQRSADSVGSPDSWEKVDGAFHT